FSLFRSQRSPAAQLFPYTTLFRSIVGSSGGEFGVRGHLDAFNLETGEHAWRCYTVPKPGEPGSDTWPKDGEAWARGGANCWVTGDRKSTRLNSSHRTVAYAVFGLN